MDKFERIDSSENEQIVELRYLQFCMKFVSSNKEPRQEEMMSFPLTEGDKGWHITEDLALIVTDSFQVDKIRWTLPNVIQLNDLRPGEPRYMRRRSRQVARYHKVNRTKKPHEYYYSELQLYSKFTEESKLEPDDLEKCKLLYEQKSEYNNLMKIENVKEVLMPYLQSVQEGTEKAQEMLKSNIGDTMDPEHEQDNEDCEDIGFTDHPDFLFKDPDELDTSEVEQRRYRMIELSDDQTIDDMTSKLDEDQRIVLETGVDFAKSIVKAKKAKELQINPPLLIIQGGAGAGKSTVIEVLCQQMEKIFRASGDNPDHPYIIKAAFTGTAAANIKGQTMHHAFTFNFGNEFFSLGDKARDERRNELENLKIVIIDEFSMIKADMLYQLDLRLREVKLMPDTVFGGLSVFLFGDILQLRPIRARFSFEEPWSESFQLVFLISSLWEQFEVIILRHNHRQGEDMEYADLLNRARVGEVTDEDVQLLETRVRPINHPDLPREALVVVCTNDEVNRINEDRLADIEETEYVIEAINYTGTQRHLKSRTDANGAVSGTPLQKTIKLKIGAKVMMTYNVDTCDSLTNGAFGEVLGYKFDKDGQVKQVYVHFFDDDCGKLRRKNCVELQSKFPGKNATPVDLMEFQYSLSKKGSNSNATVIQYPLRLAFAATAHKVQGQTIKKPNYLVVDLRKVKEAAQAYVILSRVQALCQLFILDRVCANTIRANPKAMEELNRMKGVALNLKENSRPAFISCNVRSIRKNFQELSIATGVKEAEVICIQETWLDPSANDANFLIDQGYQQHNNSVGRGRGITTFFKPHFVVEKDVSKVHYQMTKLKSDSIDVINVYRSTGVDNKAFLEDLSQLIKCEKQTLILGDLNICYNSENSNDVFTTLRNMGFKQLVKYPTHTEGRLIDHAFYYCLDGGVCYEALQQAQFYTDHDLIKIVKGNGFLS